MPKNKASSLPLNANEIAYLQQMDSIGVCVNPDWMPYDFVTQHGEYIGMNADFQKIFAEWIGKEIRLIKTLDWEQSLEYVKQRKCAILSSATRADQRLTFLLFTRPYNVYPIVIATRSEQPFITNIQDVLQKKFVAVKGFAALDLLKQKYPQMVIMDANDARTGLEWVATGKAFGYLDTVATIGYQSQKHGILNIKISGVTDVYYSMSVAVRSDQPLMQSIFDKAVASLTEADKLTILNKWISIRYENNPEQPSFDYLPMGVGILLLLLAFREIVLNRYKTKLQALNDELEQLSNTDTLTGIANRRRLNQAFAREIARARRYHLNFSLIMLDIDHFKAINDTLGHQTGDYVLKTLATLLGRTIRTNDLVGRWGGEEFLLLCPQTDLNGALLLAENIRQKIQQYDFGIGQNITVSLGVAQYSENQALETLIENVDTALYDAKKAGRNHVKASRIMPKDQS